MFSKKPAIWVVIGLLVAVSLLSSLPGNARANELDDKLRELEQMQKDIEEYKRQVENKRAAANAVEAELERLEEELRLSEKELQYIQARTEYLNARVAETKEEISQIEARLAAQKGAFETRLVSMYKTGASSYTEVLLSSKSMSEFLARLYYLREISRQDVDVINQYAETRKQLVAKQQELESEITELSAMRQQQEEKRAVVASRSQDRERYLAQIQSEKAALEQALDAMERQSRALEEVIRQLQAQGHRPTKNEFSMMWPVSGGWISSYYGNRLHPILGYYRWHSGIDIAIDYGEPIKAVEDGTVIFSGLNGGYGYCVIIDHGGGISSLYAHCSSLTVRYGQNVTKGQTIAYVGSTGLSTGPHLHFEVRVNGSTDDPLKWLP